MKVVLLHNLCSYNLEPNSKDNSEYAVLCSLLQALTRGRGAAEQDFCAKILGAKQNVCWVGTDRGSAGHASPVKWCLNEKVELLCKLAMPRLSSGVAMPRLSSGV